VRAALSCGICVSMLLFPWGDIEFETHVQFRAVFRSFVACQELRYTPANRESGDVFPLFLNDVATQTDLRESLFFQLNSWGRAMVH